MDNFARLDHLKYYISLTQKARMELENGNGDLFNKYFEEANEHLFEIGWDAFIMNNNNN